MNEQDFFKKFDSLLEQRKKILRMMLSGKTDKEIAESLVIKEATVRKHIQNIGEHFDIGTDKIHEDTRYDRRGELMELCKKYNLADSDLYVERSPAELNSYQELLKPGSLVRIKAPQQMGKTSLLSRVLSQVRAQDYQTVTLDFQLADSTVFSDYEKFLQWFCANVSDALELSDRVDELWKDMFGLNKNCTRYFQKYLLQEIQTPLVLGLDNVDLVFEQPALFNDFCNLLRGWYEQAQQGDRIGKIWQKIRLIVVHSTDVYRSMNINSSPLNVGLPVELSEFNAEQVQELVRRQGLNWNQAQIQQLMEMVGGHPALVQQAIACVKRQDITFDRLLATAPTEEGAFRNHLGQHLQNLRQYPELTAALLDCVTAAEPVEVPSEIAFKLHSMGLVKLVRNQITPSCNLYRQYFADRLE